MRKVVLSSLRQKRGYTLAELAAECRKHDGGKGIGVTQLSAYLSGNRAVGEVHFRILCLVLRIPPEDVYTSLYLAGGRGEPIAA